MARVRAAATAAEAFERIVDFLESFEELDDLRQYLRRLPRRPALNPTFHPAGRPSDPRWAGAGDRPVAQAGRTPSRPRRMIAPLGVGMVGFGVSLGAQFVGTDLSTAVNGALVTSASPAFILLFAALILREKLSVRRIASVALATAGVLVIVDPRR